MVGLGVLLTAAAACEGREDTSGAVATSETTDAATAGGSTTGEGSATTATNAGTTTTGSSTASDSGAAGSSATGTDPTNGSTSGATTATDTTTGNDPNAMPSELPTAVAPCPEFASGTVEFEFGDGRRRPVELYMREGAALGSGPLVFYWHGSGSGPTEAPMAGLGDGALERILDEGGIVVAPYSDPESGQFPWFLVLGSRQDDLELADQVLACAIRGPGIDVRRIHSMGMSAGGLQTSQMSLRRSNYIASVAVYSGGVVSFDSVPVADPANRFPAMTFHGGDDDVRILRFKETTEVYVAGLRAAGHFAFICDHGRGHMLPRDGSASAWQFLADHPYGTFNSPYADGLPADFPAYCAL
jgi:poly(3-hydroxybutyrate) depolymerase